MTKKTLLNTAIGLAHRQKNYYLDLISYLHFMFSLGTLYIMMTLTYWFNISQAAEASKVRSTLLSLYNNFQDNNPLIIAGWAPVWVKMGSAWVCILLYIWTMIAPAVLQHRDFGF